MRRLMCQVVFLVLTTAASQAQGDATPDSSNNAINPKGNATSQVNVSGTVDVVRPSALAQGSNSFTEDQARSRLAGAGFVDVTPLKKDDHGIWRGRASRNGRAVDVGFDYKGTIGAD